MFDVFYLDRNLVQSREVQAIRIKEFLVENMSLVLKISGIICVE